MRRLTGWGCIASVVLCLLCGAVRAERDTYRSASDEEGRKWWWPFGSKKQEEPAKAPAKPAAKPAQAPAPPPIMDPADEQAKFLRRQHVCDRIREIAWHKGDTDLEIQAQLLEQKAWVLYEQRTLRGRAAPLFPEPKAGDDTTSANTARSTPRRPADRPTRSIAGTQNPRPGEED